MSLSRVIQTLLFLVLGLPVVHAVLYWSSALLAAKIGDPGAGVVDRIGSICLVVWLVAAVGLLIAVAAETLRLEGTRHVDSSDKSER